LDNLHWNLKRGQKDRTIADGLVMPGVVGDRAITEGIVMAAVDIWV